MTTPPLPEAAPRRPRVGPGAPVGVTEAMIHGLVHGFYDRIRADAVLGPIFEGQIAAEAWDTHLAKMCDFWSSVMLMTGRFKGAPMATHVRIPGIGPAEFGRWLALFGETAADLCPPEAAAVFVERAEMIARSLQLGIAASRGELPPARSASAPPP